MQHATPQLQAFATGRSIAGAPFEVRLSEQIARNEVVIANNQDLIALYPQMTPFEMGAADAAAGEPFAPECVFGNNPLRIMYVQGFLAARPDCAPALMYKAQQIAAGVDMYLFGQHHRIWNEWHAEGYAQAKAEWEALQAGKLAKPGLNWNDDADEEIGRYEYEHRHNW